MPWYFYIGLIAAIAIAAFSTPQLVYTIKTKNTSGISLFMFIILAFGDFCFVLDGIGMLADNQLAGGLPVFLGNLICLGIASAILSIKIRNMVWAKKFKTTEKQFCENYASYKTKIKITKAEKAKAKELKIEEPKDTTVPPQSANTPISNGDTTQVI